jgi:hypothetical protein
MPIDTAQQFDSTINDGVYFVMTDTCAPLHGNGWCADSVVCDALDLKLITYDGTEHKIKACCMLHKRLFEAYANAIVKTLKVVNKRIMDSWALWLKTTPHMTNTMLHKTVRLL